MRPELIVSEKAKSQIKNSFEPDDWMRPFRCHLLQMPPQRQSKRRAHP